MLGHFLAISLAVLAASDGDHPLVKTLLESPGKLDPERKDPFFAALAELARSQGLDPEDYVNYKSRNAFSIISEGRAERIGDHVLVILTVVPIETSGTSAEQLILLDSKGKILDKIACGINSRYGLLKTELLEEAEEDGARIVIRFVPNYESGWHNWHTITRRDRVDTYREIEQDRPTIWDRKGLCRLAIRDDGFEVIFPDFQGEEPPKGRVFDIPPKDAPAR